MSSEDKDSKTEEGSERKLAKARAEGNTWSSREGGHLLAYLAGFVICALVLPLYAPSALMQLGAVFSTAGQVQLDEIGGLRRVMGQIAGLAGLVLLPAFAVLFAAALLSAVSGGPLVVALKRVQPKPSKLNPLSGLKRIFGVQNIVEFLKSLGKLVLLAAASLWSLKAALDQILPGALVLPHSLLPMIGTSAQQILLYAVLILLPFVIFDIFWKRFQWLKSQRMSKQDQKEESKDTDGDPHIRAKRQEMRMRARRRPHQQTVPEATLVITNPTHYAIALRYERGLDAAPVCLAKGTDLMARQIREIAFAHDIAVIESPPLARALYASTEEDQMIPEDHWAAVAELVGYVLDLRRRIRRPLPSGAHHLRP